MLTNRLFDSPETQNLAPDLYALELLCQRHTYFFAHFAMSISRPIHPLFAWLAYLASVPVQGFNLRVECVRNV